VFIIHNGIDSELPTVPARPKQEGQKKKILFLGRVTRQKGPTFLVETALHLIKKYPNVVFVVAGIGDRLRATMQHVRNRKLFEHFEFVGFLDRQQVAEMLAEADAYFMPSVSEPFGLAALEAANAQVPVVVSKQAGINEALPDLLKADYWDTEKFANYLYALLSYPALSAEMNRLTASQVSNLTWEKAAEDIVYLYQQLREGTTA
jgi:glycosyltransferase involved in cell wall biosynthesis